MLPSESRRPEMHLNLDLFGFNGLAPILHGGLPGPRHRELVRGCGFGDSRTGSDDSAGLYRHRRHKLDPRADKDTVTDYRPVFIGAIVVTRDGAAANVNVNADFRVADIGQVVYFAAPADVAFLDLNKVTYLSAVG